MDEPLRFRALGEKWTRRGGSAVKRSEEPLCVAGAGRT